MLEKKLRELCNADLDGRKGQNDESGIRISNQHNGCDAHG